MKLPNNPAKYEVLIKQYLRSILDMSALDERLIYCKVTPPPLPPHPAISTKLSVIIYTPVWKEVI